ncbi:MAG: hypothetical protein ABL921_11425, partial [Pirellula sp.]
MQEVIVQQSQTLKSTSENGDTHEHLEDAHDLSQSDLSQSSELSQSELSQSELSQSELSQMPGECELELDQANTVAGPVTELEWLDEPNQAPVLSKPNESAEILDHYDDEVELPEDEEEKYDWSVLTTATPRTRRPEASILRNAIPPILGGLAAFPIATAIMWYGFGRDIGTAGPFVARYVPWIVPQKISGLPSGHTRNSPIPSPSRSFNEEVISSQNIDQKPPPTNPPEIEPKPSNEQAPSQVATSLSNPVESEQSNSQPTPTRNTNHQISAEKISESTDSILQLRNQLYAAPRSEKQALAIGYYQSIVRLSEVFASTPDANSAASRSHLERLSKELLADKNSVTLIQLGVSGGLPGVKQAGEGDYVAIVHSISDLDHPDSDRNWQLNKEWINGTQSIPVVIKAEVWQPELATPSTACLFLGKLTAIEGTLDNREVDNPQAMQL